MTNYFSSKPLNDLNFSIGISPFGVSLKNRDFTSEKYRYGMNGQERDDEVSGEGNSYTAEFWMYSPRIGKRWEIDPYSKKYPWQSPYATFNNNPVYFLDYFGLEGQGGGDNTYSFSSSSAGNGGEIAGFGKTQYTPDGNTLSLPAGTPITTFSQDIVTGGDSGTKYSVQEGSVSSFYYNGENYNANFNPNTGTFDGYRSASGYSLSLSSNNLPSLLTGGTNHSTSLSMAGMALTTSETGVGAVVFSLLAVGALAWESYNAVPVRDISDDFAITKPIPITVPTTDDVKFFGDPPMHYQYRLVATQSTDFAIMTWGQKYPSGIMHLDVGDTWKFGTSIDPDHRYSQAWLSRNSLRLEREFYGTASMVIFMEKMKIASYYFTFGKLPPGNKGVK